jgi:hypothetical protein
MAITLNGTTGLAGNVTGNVTGAVTGDVTGNLTGTLLAGGSLTRMTQQTASGQNIDFSPIPSWAKRITVMLSAVSFTINGVINLQLGTTSAFATTGYIGASENLTSGSVGSSSLASATGFNGTFAAGDSGTISGNYVLTNLTGNTWTCVAVLGATNPGVILIAGAITLSSVLTRLRCTNTGSETFDAGTINVIYEG